MKNSVIICCVMLSLLFGCGLKYVPVDQYITTSERERLRKQTVELYIWNAYKVDSTVKYIPIVFSETTVIKPLAYQQLDSLYEQKYFNEQIKKYSLSLEEEIQEKKTEILNGTEKLRYLEHHVYGISNAEHVDIYYAEILFDAQFSILNFTITQHWEIDSALLSMFHSYITQESILYKGYQPTQEEFSFYTFYEQELNLRASYAQNSFLNHMLSIFDLARSIQSIDTQALLANMVFRDLSTRIEDNNKIKIHKIESIWDNQTLLYYQVTVVKDAQTIEVFYSPYLEKIDV